LLAVGCDGQNTVRVWGTVNYQGRAVEEGQIIFFPLEDTDGPSTGGAIEKGSYDIPAKSGPRAGGVYQVQITGTGPARSYSPDASGVGPKYTVREQYIPARFNKNSRLQVNIAERGAKNEHDFDLR